MRGAAVQKKGMEGVGRAETGREGKGIGDGGRNEGW